MLFRDGLQHGSAEVFAGDHGAISYPRQATAGSREII